MFWRPTKGCDSEGCGQNSGEHIEPLIGSKGFKWFEIDGEYEGRSYVGHVLLCPTHTTKMENYIAGAGPSLTFTSFRGGEKREPEWKVDAA